MNTFTYEQISKVGWPAFFIFGLIRGWWAIRPHVEMMMSRITDLTSEIAHARDDSSQAMDLAEKAQEVATAALDVNELNKELLEQLQGQIATVISLLDKEKTQ